MKTQTHNHKEIRKMKLVIKIDLDNAAFGVEDENREPVPEVYNGSEICRILVTLAHQRFSCRLVRNFDAHTIKDINGQTCGHYHISK